MCVKTTTRTAFIINKLQKVMTMWIFTCEFDFARRAQLKRIGMKERKKEWNQKTNKKRFNNSIADRLLFHVAWRKLQNIFNSVNITHKKCVQRFCSVSVDSLVPCIFCAANAFSVLTTKSHKSMPSNGRIECFASVAISKLCATIYRIRGKKMLKAAGKLHDFKLYSCFIQ